MVEHEHHGHAAAGEALDDPHLPQRQAVVEPQTGEVSAQPLELCAVPGCRQADPVHVPGDVELGVLGPHREIEVERSVDDLLPQLRYRPQPYREGVTEGLEAVAAGDRRRVELQNREDLQMLGCGLEGDEAGVESADPLRIPHDRNDTSCGFAVVPAVRRTGGI